MLRTLLKEGHTEAQLEAQAAVRDPGARAAVDGWQRDPKNAAEAKRIAAEKDPVVRDALQLFHARAADGLFQSYDQHVPPHEAAPAGPAVPRTAADDARDLKHFRDEVPKIDAGMATNRAEHFDLSLDGVPVSGGIVLGNRVTAPGLKPVAVRFVEAADHPRVEVTLADGRRVWFDSATATELWCAWHVVRPTAAMKRKYALRDAECNLVSCTEHPIVGGLFAVHPALHDTPVGRHAMSLDLILDFADDHARPLLEQRHALQWYDAPARMEVVGSALRVRPATDPRETLLRLRYWGFAAPKAPLGDPESAVGFAATYHLAHRLKVTAAPGTDARPYAAPAAFADPALMHGVIGRLGGKLPAPGGDELGALFDRHECVRQMDRFARVLAMMNWLGDHLGDPLPQLPPWVKPVRFPVAGTLSRADLPPIPPSAIEQLLRVEADPASKPGDRERWELGTRNGAPHAFRRVTERIVGQRVETRVWQESAARRGAREVRTGLANVFVADQGKPMSYLFGVVAPTEEVAWMLEFGQSEMTGRELADGVWKLVERTPLVLGGTTLDDPVFSPARGLALRPGERRERRVWVPRCGTFGTEVLSVVGPEKVVIGSKTHAFTRVDRTVAVTGEPTKAETLLVDAEGEPIQRWDAEGVEWTTIPKPANGRVRLDAQLARGAPCDPPLKREETVSKMSVRVHFSQPGAASKVPTDARQKVLRRTAWSVDLELLDTRDPAAAPAGPGTGGEVRAYIRPEFSGVALDAAVTKRAAEFAPPGVSDRWALARAYEQQIRSRIGVNYGKVRTDPSEIAVAMEGSCLECAILLVSLCRSREIPARFVTGLTYDADTAAFYGHAWVEVRAGGAWVPLDGTLGRGGAPATHIRWSDGVPGPNELSGAFNPRVIRVEVLSTEHRPEAGAAPRVPIKVEPVRLDANGIKAAQASAFAYFFQLVNAAVTSGDARTAATGNADRFGSALGLPATSGLPPGGTGSMVDTVNALIFVRHRWGADARDALRRRFGEPVAAAYDLAWCAISLQSVTATGRVDPNWPEVAELVRATAATAGRAGWTDLEKELTERLRPQRRHELTADYLRGIADRIAKRFTAG